MGQRLRAFTLTFFRASEAIVGLPIWNQSIGIGRISVHLVGLRVGWIGSANVRTFVPIQPQPLEILQQLSFVARLTAFDVGVFDAKYERTVLLPRKKPVEERRSNIPDVELPGGRGSKTDANFSFLSHCFDVNKKAVISIGTSNV